VLGAEQHGFIVSVGFDLYVQLLDEAIREMKGQEPVPELPPVSIDLAVDAYIPDTYVGDPRQKIDLYKKLAAVTTLEDADEVAEEMLDRYGHPPVAADNLLAVCRIKVHARKLGITSISQQAEHVMFKFATIDKRRLEAIAGFVKGLKGRFAPPTLRTPVLTMRLESPKVALQASEQLLRRLAEIVR
jgi:transcription-repair coupling factor (superfamily II helicase)